jgi:predicted HD phosphohydrolase
VHEYRAHKWLRNHFGPEVTEPVRLHVDAKRYLCATEPGYYDALSADSKRSLVLQGGTYDAPAAAAFAAQPGALRAVALRRWDDAAKVAGAATPPLEYFVSIMEAVRRA